MADIIYNFDEIIDRRGTGAVKYDCLTENFGRDGLIPLWVADMDFATPPFIISAIRERLEHPVLGYTCEPAGYRPAVVEWIREHHGWDISPDWIAYIPGIVKGIGMVVNAFVSDNEKVIIQPPVYHPFRIVPTENRRTVVENPLIEHPDGTYTMDLEGLERIVSTDPECRLLILSNPHNPAGIVWDRATLERVASIAYRHGLIVISDEIHCDMALWGKRHIPFASVSEEAASCSITFGAPTKTFNIAGIVSSYAIVPNPALRERFFAWLKANEFDSPNMFAPIATMAAFSAEGEEWRRQMLRYVEGNVDFVTGFCRRELPGIRALRPDASFLVWLDCRGLGLSHRKLLHAFIAKAGLALNDGAVFGAPGFMRLNVGCPRSVLSEAMNRLKKALESDSD